MSNWQELLQAKKVLLADGAWGTELARHGLPAGEAPEKWNIENPAAVQAVAQGYVDAGADIILSNSFGGSRPKLEKVGLADSLDEINRKAAEISKAAAGDNAIVFASVGPTGEFMAPLGTVTEDEMVAIFAEQVKALAAGGADAIVIETMTALDEAKAALRAVKENSDLPAAVSFTFDKGPAGYATMMGVKPAQAAAEISAAGADLVGSNCGLGIAEMAGISREMKQATALPLWAKANAGLPQLVDGKTVFLETPEQMAARVADIIEAGASVIGGCCGTTPDHIRLMAAACANLR